ncbi:MAG: hypothetical protein MJ252_13630 [archaeon]|nr:hypothetical protein [archaeon]
MCKINYFNFFSVETIINETLRALREFCEKVTKDTQETNNKTDKNEIKVLNPNALNKGSDKYSFVLKLEAFEEYLYGDYSLSAYQCIRRYVRQFEPVKLVLFKKRTTQLEPVIMFFPPIIRMPANETFTYYDLLKKYFENYPRQYAIFRFGELSEEEKDQFLIQKTSRQERLKRYTESGECDCPLSMSIVGVYNLKALFKWFYNDAYMENEMMLHYFNVDFETNIEHEEKKFINKLQTKLGCRKDPTYANIKDKNIIKAKKKEKKEKMKEYKKQKSIIKRSLTGFEEIKNNINIMKIEEKANNTSFLAKNLLGQKTSVTLYKNAQEKKQDYETKEEEGGKGQKYPNPIYRYPAKPNGDKHFNFQPVFINIKIQILYGSFVIKECVTQAYFIGQNVNINEEIVFQHEQLIISHLPRETRLGISLQFLSGDKKSVFEIASCQVPLFKEEGLFNSGELKINLWPFYKVEPRCNCCEQFLSKFSYHKKRDDEQKAIEREKEMSQEDRKKEKKNKNQDQKPEQEDPDYKEDKDYFTYIIIKLPKFAKKLAHVPKTPTSYLDFKKFTDSDLNDLEKEYKEMVDEMGKLIDFTEETKYTEDDGDGDENAKFKMGINSSITEGKEGRKKKTFISDVDERLKDIERIIKIDPLKPISQKERETVLLCRDYLSTMPNALDTFLRSINWFNPLESYLGHLYLKKWSKLEVLDAIGLLDARFPDIQVRELAIKTLNSTTQDVIELYTMELCQCLFYESYLLNPLADFLIQKCLSSQKLIGNKFYWSCKVAMANPLFKPKLVYNLAQMFMVSGPSYIETIFKKDDCNDEFSACSMAAKMEYAKKGLDAATKAVKDKLNKWNTQPRTCNFELPVHPSYYVTTFQTDSVKVFDSKMVPIRLPLVSSDGKIVAIMFKIGDDLRQDVLTLQLFKIMDNMWLENDLDLKINTYEVCPISLKSGVRIILIFNFSLWNFVKQKLCKMSKKKKVLLEEHWIENYFIISLRKVKKKVEFPLKDYRIIL